MPVTALLSTPSTNAENLQYIIENLEYIVGTTLGFNLEYDIADDEIVETTPAAIIHYVNETFEETFGQKPKYNNVELNIMIKFRESNPNEIRSRAVDYTHLLREGITIDTLNTVALSASQIVSRVEHLGSGWTTETPIIQGEYPLIIRYREKPSC